MADEIDAGISALPDEAPDNPYPSGSLVEDFISKRSAEAADAPGPVNESSVIPAPPAVSPTEQVGEPGNEVAPVDLVHADIVPASTPVEPSAGDTRVDALEQKIGQLTDLVSTLTTSLQAANAAPTEPAKVDQPWDISDGAASIARSKLGPGISDDTASDYTQALADHAYYSRYLNHASPEHVEAAKQGIAGVEAKFRDIQRQAVLENKIHDLQTAPSAPVSMADVESKIRATITTPEKLSNALQEFPALQAAIDAGAYNPADLLDGIEFNESVVDALDQKSRVLNAAFSRVKFNTPTEKPAGKPEQTSGQSPAGVTVSNPRSFAMPRDEAKPAVPWSGYKTAAELNAEVMASLGVK